ncbi:MAG: 2-amino-4-hydroxy-6-hydroxymethyldihydropteridine diphosphokinase [Candidatus Omnitrophota bacterium]
MIYLGIGSNSGNRYQNIQRAIRALSQTQNINIVCVSSIYETTPLGGPKQNNFLNVVLQIETDFIPKQLLKITKIIEKDLGRRTKAKRWGPRIIDIDILIYHNLELHSSELTIPHPRMHERYFVLVPLSEIAPRVIHPVFKKTIKRLKQDIDKVTNESVKKFVPDKQNNCRA